ncbi:MAG: hypothetical protein LBI99_07850 [Propionibacteriaceae bacterium]|nr:hypothetical protein [Propionibacteriaceae bacterium]
MNVSHLVGITQEVVDDIVARRWSAWQEVAVDLRQFPQPVSVQQGFTRGMDGSQRQSLCRGLLQASSRLGGDDSEATSVLVWVIDPALCAAITEVRRKVSAPVDQVSERVVAWAWLLCRTLNPATNNYVPFSVKQHVVRMTLVELGHLETLKARRQSERLTVLKASDATDWPGSCGSPISQRSSTEELRDVLSQAVLHHQISDADRSVLMSLVQAASVLPSRNRKGLSLFSPQVVGVAAKSLGMQPRRLESKAKDVIARLARQAAKGLLDTDLSFSIQSGGRRGYVFSEG